MAGGPPRCSSWAALRLAGKTSKLAAKAAMGTTCHSHRLSKFNTSSSIVRFS